VIRSPCLLPLWDLAVFYNKTACRYLPSHTSTTWLSDRCTWKLSWKIGKKNCLNKLGKNLIGRNRLSSRKVSFQPEIKSIKTKRSLRSQLYLKTIRWNSKCTMKASLSNGTKQIKVRAKFQPREKLQTILSANRNGHICSSRSTCRAFTTQI